MNHTNRYQPFQTPEERSKRVTERLLLALTGVQLTLKDAEKIIELATACAASKKVEVRDEEDRGS